MKKRESDLTSLVEGVSFLTSRIGMTVAMATLGMLLAALAVLLQIYANLPSHPVVEVVLFFVSLLPLEIYFIPRFLMSIDAQVVSSPFNTPDDWSLRFKERWLRTFGVKALLALTTGEALKLFIVPGVIMFMAFCWMPMRILLRGESVIQAAKGSLEMMGRTWKKTSVVALVATTIYVTTIIVMNFALEFFVKEPTTRQRLVHPAVWVSNFVGSILSLWLSACFLALYHRTENALLQD